jgi:hypothetical protein
MCLKYGTPERFRKVFAEGLNYPEHCDDRETLQELLRVELESGIYQDPALYHPLLEPMLQGLLSRYDGLPLALQEPKYPFCDLIQCVALCFCFANGSDFAPNRKTQDTFMEITHPEVRADVYAIFRVILRSCTADDVKALWEPRILKKGGFMAMLIAAGLLEGMIELHPPKQPA